MPELGNPEQKTDQVAEREEYERRSLGRGVEYDDGRAVEAAISKHSDPETVLALLRDHMLANEVFVTFGEQPKHWRVSHLTDLLQDREEAFGKPLTLLVKRKLVQLIDSETQEKLRKQRGGSLPVDIQEQYLGYALESGGHSIRDITFSEFAPETWGMEVVEENGQKIEKYTPLTFRRVERTVSDFGSPEKRIDFHERYGKKRHELLARNLIVERFGEYIELREALFKLAEAMYFRSSLSAEGLGIIFNLRSQEGAADKTVTNVKLRNLGDKVTTAMRLYLVNALCEKPTRFRELMKKPAWRQFLFPEGTSAEQLKIWIGQPGVWEKEAEAGGIRINRDKEKRVEGTIDKERKDELRGKLTQKNIFAESNTYLETKLHEAIREFVGGNVGEIDDEKYVNKQEAEAAQRMAYRLFRLLLTADVEGYEIYSKPGLSGGDFDPLKNFELVFENGPAASDFGKLTHPDLYIIKNYRKGRDTAPMIGLLHSRRLYSRIAVDFFRQASFVVPVEIIGPEDQRETIYEERSLYEVVWGNEAGGDVPGKPGFTYPEESAMQYGDVPWTGLDPATLGKLREIQGLIPEDIADLNGMPVGGLHSEILHGGLYLTCFMAGREGGIYDLITKTDIRVEELMDEGWWRKLWKILDIGIKPGVVLEGKFKGISETRQKEITKKFKIGVVIGFLKGLQGLPQWRTLLEEEKLIPYRNKKNETTKALPYQRLLILAKEALAQEGVEIEDETWAELMTVKS